MDLKEVAKLLSDFEKRNNFSASLVIHSDLSGSINDFWEDKTIESFNKIDDCISFLQTTQYKLDDEGYCISPLVKINNQK